MDDTIAHDLLIGIKAISEFTGFTDRQIYHMATKPDPLFVKEPGLGFVASKSALRQRYRIPDGTEQ